MFKLPRIEKDLLNYDLTNFPSVVILALIFFISRIPFINLGFSTFSSKTDYDTLSVVNSAFLIRYNHVYTVSRFPGYPLYEFANALFIQNGWIATNTATMIVSFISVVVFGKILNIFKIENRALLVIAFAFFPLLWINSVITMDYMWALMFILLGSYLAFKSKYSIAGIAIGFSVGMRFTSAFMIIPILFWAFSEKGNIREALAFVSISVITALLLFWPVFSKYELEFLHGSGYLSTTPIMKPISMLSVSVGVSFNNMIMELFGIVALIFLIFFVIFSPKNRQFIERKQLLNFCWLTGFIFVSSYFIFPYKVPYLIPIIPWGLIAINEKLMKPYAIMVCILLLLNSIVAVEIVNDGTPHIRLAAGTVIKNYEDRKISGLEQSKRYMESLTELSKNMK
ncbi:MAG: hypothetical protein O8C65_11965 [Candidatus Methanoperedens sp.]|nr:hypothetical protein [Candidatus Methanoperedens sp.]